MWNKIILLLLVICCLPSQNAGGSLKLAAEKCERFLNTEMSTLSPRSSLEMVALIGLSEFSKYIVDNGRIIFRNMLKDIDELELNTESKSFQSYISKIRDLQKDNLPFTGKFDELVHYLILSDKIETFIRTFENEPESQELIVLVKLFKDNGGEKFQRDIKERSDNFYKTFSQNFDSYTAKLTPEEKAIEEKHFFWYKMYREPNNSTITAKNGN